MKTIAFYNLKGGVGKTSTAVNISYLSVQENRRTLLIDLDPQGSASFYFRIRPRKKFRSKQFLQGGLTIADNIRGTDFAYLDLLPSHISFGKMDLALDQYKKSKSRLKKVLRPLGEEYDVLFLDCPPNITLLSENVFRTADILLVPLIPTPLSLITYEKISKFFKSNKIDDSKIHAFFSMVERRKTIHREISQSIPKRDSHFLKPVIPYAAEIEKMGIHRTPLFLYQKGSAAAAAYRDLWRTIKSKVLME